jgi:predicted RNase H-like HicB family nuclease
MYRFLVVIEKASDNYSAYSPDLPGCVATGATREEAENNMHEAVELHVKGLLEDNLPVPPQTAVAEYVAVGTKTSPQARRPKLRGIRCGHDARGEG